MKIIDIFGDNRYETFSKVREGSRGIVVQDGKILLSHEENTDYWLLPGGGLEAGETPEECCVREVLEETGYRASVIKQYLQMNEYYEEYKYIDYFFVCEVVAKEEQNLTSYEKERGLIPVWLDLKEAVAIFEKHQEYAATNEEKRGAYLREYTALCEYLKMK